MNPIRYFQRRLILVWLAALMLISAVTSTPIVEAKIYKWRDSEGNIHFSDRPRPVRNAKFPQPALDTPTSQSEEISAELPYIHRIQAPEIIFPKRRPSVTTQSVQASKRHKSNAINAKKLAIKCQGYRKLITSINKQLRSGYREPKGNRLRAKRRELSDKLYRECR